LTESEPRRHSAMISKQTRQTAARTARGAKVLGPSEDELRAARLAPWLTEEWAVFIDPWDERLREDLANPRIVDRSIPHKVGEMRAALLAAHQARFEPSYWSGQRRFVFSATPSQSIAQGAWLLPDVEIKEIERLGIAPGRGALVAIFSERECLIVPIAATRPAASVMGLLSLVHSIDKAWSDPRPRYRHLVWWRGPVIEPAISVEGLVAPRMASMFGSRFVETIRENTRYGYWWLQGRRSYFGKG
jgi:hypothetical protein